MQGHLGQRSEILHETLYGQYTCHVKIQAQSEKKNKSLDSLMNTIVLRLARRMDMNVDFIIQDLQRPSQLSNNPTKRQACAGRGEI